MWALSQSERLRKRVINDVLIAHHFGAAADDLREVLVSCDLPNPLGDATGFWRVDRHQPPELRQSVLASISYQDIVSRLSSTPTFDHWMLPELVRISDHGIGHDDRSERRQAVATKMGYRYYDWQVAQHREESWRECRLHAKLHKTPAQTQ